MEPMTGEVCYRHFTVCTLCHGQSGDSLNTPTQCSAVSLGMECLSKATFDLAALA